MSLAQEIEIIDKLCGGLSHLLGCDWRRNVCDLTHLGKERKHWNTSWGRN
jgi:hypothetical protein